MKPPADSRPRAADGRPRASVVIPTFRRTEPLRALLDSLALQSLAAGELEIVLADDGSGEGVANLAAEYEGRFPRFRYITGENAGPGVARNRGVATAAADTLLFVDSDCLVTPGWAEALTSAIEGGAPIAFGPTRSSVPALEPFVHSIVSEHDLITFTNVAFAREVFERLGGFRPEISRIAEDRDLFARARTAGYEPQWFGDAVVIHPPRPKSIRFADLWAAVPAYRDLHAFYVSQPDFRPHAVRTNRALLFKGALKLWVATMPLGLPTLVAHTLLRRREVNRRLAAAGLPFRVPAAAAVKYGLLQPVNDLVHLARRRRAGFGWFRLP